jgi:hypothetical protein
VDANNTAESANPTKRFISFSLRERIFAGKFLRGQIYWPGNITGPQHYFFTTLRGLLETRSSHARATLVMVEDGKPEKSQQRPIFDDFYSDFPRKRNASHTGLPPTMYRNPDTE